MEICAPLREGLAQAGALAAGGAAAEALEQLSRTADVLEAFGLSDRVRLDFSLVNSLDYYNGVIFQGFLPGGPLRRALGGRYDNLPRKMGKKVGAVGFALYMGLVERYFGGQRPQEADLLLTYGPDADLEGLGRSDRRTARSGPAGPLPAGGRQGPGGPLRPQARYHTGMGRRRWAYDQRGAAQRAAGREGRTVSWPPRATTALHPGEEPEADLRGPGEGDTLLLG